MSLDIHQIAEAFCSYKFVVTYPYMADEIKWNIVGREELMGREAVIDSVSGRAIWWSKSEINYDTRKKKRASREGPVFAG